MNSQEKKKKSLLRRILKWTGIGFLLLLIALILVPVFFKDDIKEMVIKEANKTLNAKLSMGEFDLTFISTFPNMTIELNDTKLEGINEFKGVELASIKQFSAHVGFWNVVSGEQIQIDEIHLEEPRFDVRVLANGKANYDIVKPDTVPPTPDEPKEPSNFKLSLKEYSITNGMVRYDDQTSDMALAIKNLNHSGAGDLTADVIDFETKTTMDELTFGMDGVDYLSKVKTDFVINLLMEFTEKTSKFTLKENTLKVNALAFSIDGFYEMLEKSAKMDMKLDASKATFKDFLSLVPAFYATGYEKMVTNGSLDFGGKVKGVMDDKNMPSWDFHLNVDKASIKYPAVPGTISNIIVKAASTFEGGPNMDKMTLDVDKFHANFVGNSIDANLKVRNPMTDPLLIAKVLANVDMATLKKVMPMTEGESYNGKVKADVNLNGRMSSVEKGNYEAFKAAGTVEMWDLLYKTKSLNDEVAVSNLLLRFSPKNMSLEKLAAKTGRSDFQLNGTVDNYMAYVFRGALLKGVFNFSSNNLDLDQLMNLVPSTPEAANTATAKADASKTADASTTKTAAAPAEPTLVPDNIDFVMNTNIANIHYNNMDIKNVKGGVKIKDEVATLDNLTMNALGGVVGLKGDFSTKDHYKPKVDFAYDLKEIDVQELAKNFITVQKLAPIAKYAQGRISSKFDMVSSLTSNLEPIYTTLSGLGDFSTKSLNITGFEPLTKLGEALNMSKLSAPQALKDLYTKFSIQDGKLSVTPFDVKMGKTVANVAGYTSIDQSINYDIKMMIPKEDIPASMIKAAEQLLGKVNSAIPKLNMNVIPDNIPVKVNMIGTVTKPKINTNFKEALLEATGNKKALIQNVKEAVKDSVKAVVKEKINEVREDLNAKKKKLLDDAQEQANKLKEEGKKGADLVRTEADKQAAELMNQAGNNIFKQKAAEIAGNKLRKEADSKATKLEAEANQRADKLMDDARAKADQIK